MSGGKSSAVGEGEAAGDCSCVSGLGKSGCCAKMSEPASQLPIMPARKRFFINCMIVVGVTGFEPATSWSQTRRSTKLSYTPTMPEQSLARLARGRMRNVEIPLAVKSIRADHARLRVAKAGRA